MNTTQVHFAVIGRLLASANTAAQVAQNVDIQVMTMCGANPVNAQNASV